MTRQTMELANCFKRTAQAALKSNFGFSPQRLSDIEIYDGNGRTQFKFKVGGYDYQFHSYVADRSTTAPDGISVWVGKDTVTKLN